MKVIQFTRNFATGFGAVFAICLFFAFSNPNPAPTAAPQDGPREFAILTTVESIIPGGFGRSRMFLTWPNNKVDEWKIENFYSIVGINMNNINENDVAIIGQLNEMSANGWKLESVTTGVQSPSVSPDGGKGEGIFLTRYLFSREVE